MIPVKLKLRNFMCYRDNVPPLNFDGIHLACLSGDNGNGKSALIDAMTWALWGQARAKSDDELIHTSQTEMEVEFDFTVGQQLYRIIRKRSRPKQRRSSGQSILELQMATDGGFKPITGNSIAQTQQKIIAILHMDYDTFINSAYLRQGHADEFTKKMPAERKEVLAYILGLSFYDELEAEAKEMAKQQETEKSQLESAIKDIDDELAQKPNYEAELKEAQQALSQIEEAIKGKESVLGRLRQQKETLEKKKTQLEQLELHMQSTERDLVLWVEQVEKHRAKILEYEALIAHRIATEEGYSRFIEVKRINEELDARFRKMAGLNERKHRLEKAIDQASQELLREHDSGRNRIQELETKAQELTSIKNQMEQLQTQLHKLTEQEEILSGKRQTSQDLQAQVSAMESDRIRLEGEIREIKEKLDLLSTQTEAKCPLCETELTREGLELIASKYTADEQKKVDSLKLIEASLSQKRLELKSLKNELAQLESWLNQQKAKAQNEAGRLNKEMMESEEADGQLPEEQKVLGEIEQRLARKDFAAVEQAALREIETELAAINYEQAQHEQARQQLLDLEQYEPAKRRLEEAERLINQERETVAKAEAAARQRRRNFEDDSQNKQSLTVELALLPQLMKDLTEAETAYQTLATQLNQAQEIMGSVKTKLQRCADLEIKKKEKESLFARASKGESIYKELAKAFGKGGIQALLIETALPEIETEANRLLGRMTDNRMHVKFETQRETKKGNVVETLDINIADELGTRNYEMFSGGEAFRINFAIRIALSKLLAKRAGAPLPTLIIDEGFGTQDNTGIEKLKEAINSIQDDFEKIIVITHIEELRDAFPARIDVVKTAEGSTISVS